MLVGGVLYYRSGHVYMHSIPILATKSRNNGLGDAPGVVDYVGAKAAGVTQEDCGMQVQPVMPAMCRPRSSPVLAACSPAEPPRCAMIRPKGLGGNLRPSPIVKTKIPAPEPAMLEPVLAAAEPEFRYAHMLGLPVPKFVIYEDCAEDFEEDHEDCQEAFDVDPTEEKEEFVSDSEDEDRYTRSGPYYRGPASPVPPDPPPVPPAAPPPVQPAAPPPAQPGRPAKRRPNKPARPYPKEDAKDEETEQAKPVRADGRSLPGQTAAETHLPDPRNSTEPLAAPLRSRTWLAAMGHTSVTYGPLFFTTMLTVLAAFVAMPAISTTLATGPQMLGGAHHGLPSPFLVASVTMTLPELHFHANAHGRWTQDPVNLWYLGNHPSCPADALLALNRVLLDHKHVAAYNIKDMPGYTGDAGPFVIKNSSIPPRVRPRRHSPRDQAFAKGKV